MKKMTAIILCLLLLTGCALAEDTVRTGTVMLEGMNEEFEETLFVSAEGYEIWYPSEYLEPGKKYGHDCFCPIGVGGESGIYFMIVPSEADAEDARTLLSEAVGGFGPEAGIDEMKLNETDGMLTGCVGVVDGNTVYRYYLISDRQNMLLITACFPLEAAEGFGVRFDRMAESIAFIGPDAVYAGDGYSMGYFAGLVEPAEHFGKESFAPVGGSGEQEICLLVVRCDIAPEEADGLLDEAGGGYEGEFEIRRSEEETLPSGLTLAWAEVEQDGRIDKYYLIKGEQAVYCVSAVFPAAEKEYGVYFDAMIRSFELSELQ